MRYPVRVACVLRSGGDYTPEYVERLRNGVESNLTPGIDFICLSDVPVPCERIPLKHDWPGWWAKLELFRPDIDGDLLAIDLDTAIVGDLRKIVDVGKMTMLRDFYAPERPASGLMYLPSPYREFVWRQWKGNEDRYMDEAGPLGDGNAIGRMLFGQRTYRWQDLFPDEIVSYKMHVRKALHARESGNGRLPKGAKVVCFHGRPRPHEIGWEPWAAAV